MVAVPIPRPRRPEAAAHVAGVCARAGAYARHVGGLLAALSVSACALHSPSPEPPAGARIEASAPVQWQAAQPHDGSMASLGDWWSRLDDPILPALIDAAQQASPGVALAGARIVQAREAFVRATGAGLPALDAAAARLRGPVSFGGAPFLRTQDTLLAQAAWEVDLFGGIEASRRAEAARLQARAAGWHEARVSVAAEVAGRYTGFRHCEAQRALEQAELRSHERSLELGIAAAGAGFQPPAQTELLRAQRAEQAVRLQAREAVCDIAVKALVALTALDEAVLRRKLASATARLPTPAAFAIDRIPARVLAQRPDVAAAERELAAALADVDAASRNRMPRLLISGSVGPLRFDGAGVRLDTTTWSLGPTLSVPIVDAGVREASLAAARARLEAADKQWRARVREAVREVEEALVQLSAAAGQAVQTDIAVTAYRRSLGTVQTRRQAGLAGDVEIEEARRIALAAERALLSLTHERVQAWIALYRAAGGGWTPEKP